MIFFGQCAVDGTSYYNVEFETVSFNSALVVGYYARSATDNYITLTEQQIIDGGNHQRLAFFVVHFDPDTAGCANFAYNTPVTVKKYIPTNLF